MYLPMDFVLQMSKFVLQIVRRITSVLESTESTDITPSTESTEHTQSTESMESTKAQNAWKARRAQNTRITRNTWKARNTRNTDHTKHREHVTEWRRMATYIPYTTLHIFLTNSDTDKFVAVWGYLFDVIYSYPRRDQPRGWRVEWGCSSTRWQWDRAQ